MIDDNHGRQFEKKWDARVMRIWQEGKRKLKLRHNTKMCTKAWVKNIIINIQTFDGR